jgi:hypothetical protein
MAPLVQLHGSHSAQHARRVRLPIFTIASKFAQTAVVGTTIHSPAVETAAGGVYTAPPGNVSVTMSGDMGAPRPGTLIVSTGEAAVTYEDGVGWSAVVLGVKR